MSEYLKYSTWKNDKIEQELIKIARQQIEEFPDPDYGRLFWNSTTKTVHWVCGDGAGGYTEAEKRFKIPGVEKVVAADEYFPSKDESGWKQLEFRGTK